MTSYIQVEAAKRADIFRVRAMENIEKSAKQLSSQYNINERCVLIKLAAYIDPEVSYLMILISTYKHHVRMCNALNAF